MRDLARRLPVILLGLTLLAALTGVDGVRLAGADEGEGLDYTPPRLSFVDGEVAFWRPGADDWAPAQVNTPLAAGDELHTGYRGNLEIQLDGRAFVRAWGDTHLGVTDQRPAILQLKVSAGHVSLDLRRIQPAATIEVDAPHGALVLDTPGYYRVDVDPQRTVFTVRDAGRATLALAGGTPLAVGSSEQVVLDGVTVQRTSAPAPDVWDAWNQMRTAQLLAPAGARYVGSGVAGLADLDRHGAWRTEPSYGAVWVPSGVPAGWAPYSTGRWVVDPYYGWTWVDAAPWGWAPYHYGRWVYLDGVWAWAPGPIVARPVYAPALVAFFGAPGVSVTVATPFVSWVALGWGEPVVPWWRTSRFHGRPWWGGWGGPRIVNNVVVHRTTVIDVYRITEYRNARVRRAVVGVRQDSFGRRAVHEARLADADLREWRPIHGRLPVRLDRTSPRPEAPRTERPRLERPRAEAPGRGTPRPARPAYGDDRRVPARIAPAPGPPPSAPRREQPAQRRPGRAEPERRVGPRPAQPEPAAQSARPPQPGRRVGQPRPRPEQAAPQPERRPTRPAGFERARGSSETRPGR